MKKVISMLLSAAILLTATMGLEVTALAAEYSGSCGDNLTWLLDTDTGELTISGSGDMEYFSTSTSAPWYKYRTYIKTVSISDEITAISVFSFYGCTGLTSVEIPAGVTDIGKGAFARCTSLTEIIVSSDNKYFISTDGIVFNSDKTKLVCYPNGKLDTSYTVPDSVTSIVDYAFYYSKNLTSITIPDSVTKIGNYTFSFCTGLTSIIIPNGLKSISGCAFYNCSNLKDVTISDNVTNIKNSAFWGCSSLENIVIPDSVISIGTSAFRDCTSLTSISIPRSVTSIGNYLFFDCTSLMVVTIMNPDCEIYDSDDTIYSGATIYGYADSTAQTYAETYNRTFVSFESCTHTYSDGVCSICGYTPQSISLGDTNTVTISTAGDYQYYCFKPAQSGSYTFYSTGSVDTYGYVYDGNLTQLTYNDDGGSGTNFSITYSFEADTVYILACRLYSSSSTGSFDVTLTCATHSYDVTESSEATCTTDGYYVYTCSVCGDTYTETISATGHSFGDNLQYCSLCGTANPNYISSSDSSESDSNSSGLSDDSLISGIVSAVGTIGADTDSGSSTVSYVISSVALSKKSYTYNGKKRKPSIVAKDSNGNVISSDNYTVKYAKGCKKVGKYKVTVTFKGGYSGTYTFYFTIKPKGTKFTKVSSTKTSFSITWKKQKKQTTGYQIQVSSSKKFKKSASKLVTNKDPNQTTATVRGGSVVSKKTYYVRIRTYKIVKGKKYYSAWSTVKKVTTK